MKGLNIPQMYVERIREVYEIINKGLPQAEIYLFGGYAKRKIKSTSDMDILILVEEVVDKKQLKLTKWKLEEQIEEVTGFQYEVDLKIYTQEHFAARQELIGFESEIAKYMIKLEESLWK